jgi:hypothetical protein
MIYKTQRAEGRILLKIFVSNMEQLVRTLRIVCIMTDR